MRVLSLTLCAFAVCAASANAAVYEIDAAHSSVGFKVRHLVAKTAGRFTAFSGTVNFDPAKPETWSAAATIDVASINTDNEKRDGHLKSADFFDVAKCPYMSFKSTKVTDVSGSTAKLHGDLTLHCVTRPVVLDLEIGGTEKDPWGNVKMGYSAKGTINRKDFGIVWNKTLDSGGVMLGENVEIAIDIEAGVKASDAPAAKNGRKEEKKK